MSTLFSVVFFALGAVAASFIGLLVSRLHTGAALVRGRSRCDACGTTLSATSLIPIVSHLFSQGRALCCKAKLSSISTISEVLLGILFALSAVQVSLQVSLIPFLVALCALLGIVLYDLQHHIIPPVFLGVLFAASAAYAVLTYGEEALYPYGLTALGIGAFFAILHFGSRGRAMGLADAPLAFSLALLTGPAAFSGFIFSFWIGAVIGITLLARRGKGYTMKDEVPFAPFLAAGFLLAYFTQWNPFLLVSDLMLRVLGA